VLISKVAMEVRCLGFPFLCDVTLHHWMICARRFGRQRGCLMLKSSQCPTDQRVLSPQKNGNLRERANAQQLASMLHIGTYSGFRRQCKLCLRGLRVPRTLGRCPQNYLQGVHGDWKVETQCYDLGSRSSSEYSGGGVCRITCKTSMVTGRLRHSAMIWAVDLVPCTLGEVSAELLARCPW
jgi:hypothetical protein